jgi:hypothetical protein
MKVPAIEKLVRTTKHVHAARTAMWRRCLRSDPPVIARNVGIAAIGSTRTKTDVNATSAN